MDRARAVIGNAMQHFFSFQTAGHGIRKSHLQKDRFWLNVKKKNTLPNTKKNSTTETIIQEDNEFSFTGCVDKESQWSSMKHVLVLIPALVEAGWRHGSPNGSFQLYDSRMLRHSSRVKDTAPSNQIKISKRATIQNVC